MRSFTKEYHAMFVELPSFLLFNKLSNVMLFSGAFENMK